MNGQVDNKVTWVIKNFSCLHSDTIYSDVFVIGGCKWRLAACAKGYNSHFSLFLFVADSESLPCGWRRYAGSRFTVVNQIPQKPSHVRVTQPMWFDHKAFTKGCRNMIPLAKLSDKDGGFLVNNEVKVVAEVEVLEVAGLSDLSTTQPPLKRIKLENGANSNHLLNTAQLVKESVDVNGFHVLPSQVGFVRRIFEKHPDMALEFRSENQNLRSSCMNVLLTLIETLCQSLQEISDVELKIAGSGLTYVKDAGFKVDWLEKKLEEVKQKKNQERIVEAKIEKFVNIREESKETYSNAEAMIEKEKAKVVEARASRLTFEDVL